MSVNRWSITDGCSERIVDPPSVAAAIDGAFRMEDDRAVWINIYIIIFTMFADAPLKWLAAHPKAASNR